MPRVGRWHGEWPGADTPAPPGARLTPLPEPRSSPWRRFRRATGMAPAPGPGNLCQGYGQSGAGSLGCGSTGFANCLDKVGRGCLEESNRARGTHRIPDQGDACPDPRPQREPGPARGLRPRSDQPRGDRPPHRPDPHIGRGAGRRARARRPRPRGRPRPEHRRQGSRPSSRSSTTPATWSPSTSASAPSRRPSSTSAARSASGSAATSTAPTATPRSPSSTTWSTRSSPARTRPILGIGVGAPGIVDGDGTIRWAVNLAWTDLPLGNLLHARYGFPTIVANDSRAAALATFLFEGEDRPANLVAIKVGRGIGAGLVLDGELFGGDGDGAGEIGHIVVEPDGAECHCGRFGCLETVASAPAILRAAAAAGLPATSRSPSWQPRPQPATRPRWPSSRAAGRALGTAVANLIGILDVRDIVLHGSVTVLGEPWLDAIRDEATRRIARPARARDPHRRRRDRRGPDPARRLRAAADQRARPDGAPMTDDRRAPIAADPFDRRPRPPAPRRRRRRRQQDRGPRRRPRRARARPPGRPDRRRSPRTARPTRSPTVVGDGPRRSRCHDRRRRRDRRRRPRPRRPADRHGHPRGQPRLVGPAARAGARGPPRSPDRRRERRPCRGARPPSTPRRRRHRRPGLPRGRDRGLGRGRPPRPAPSRRPRPRRRDRPRHRRARRRRLRLRPARLPRDLRVGLGDRAARARSRRIRPRDVLADSRENAAAIETATGLSAAPGAPTAVDVYLAAARGDPLATEIADAVGRRLAWAVHLLVMTYDVERVVLGGGVSHAGEAFVRADPARAGTDARGVGARAGAADPRDRGAAPTRRRCRAHGGR